MKPVFDFRALAMAGLSCFRDHSFSVELNGTQQMAEFFTRLSEATLSNCSVCVSLCSV